MGGTKLTKKMKKICDSKMKKMCDFKSMFYFSLPILVLICVGLQFKMSTIIFDNSNDDDQANHLLLKRIEELENNEKKLLKKLSQGEKQRKQLAVTAASAVAKEKLQRSENDKKLMTRLSKLEGKQKQSTVTAASAVAKEKLQRSENDKKLMTRLSKLEGKQKQSTATTTIASGAAATKKIKKFQRYENVAIVTKVHWPNDLEMLQQSMCLFKAAYNRHVNYDIIVFTTIPWDEKTVNQLADVVEPAKLQVVVDSPPLEERIEKMTGVQRSDLYQRCNVDEGTNISWFHNCTEPGYHIKSNLAFAWQAEFRARHLWTNQALKPYNYMIWMDSDTMCTKDWNVDPMKMMVENKLVLMYDNFPSGLTNNQELKEKMMIAYDKSVCRVLFDETKGNFITKPCATPDTPEGQAEVRIHKVHGFHHITDLSFYRSEMNMKFFRTFIGNRTFGRQLDDRIAVTIPAAILEPQKAWDYEKHGINVSLLHNGLWDGKKDRKAKSWSFKHMWYGHKEKGITKGIKNSWPAGKKLCNSYIKVRG